MLANPTATYDNPMYQGEIMAQRTGVLAPDIEAHVYKTLLDFQVTRPELDTGLREQMLGRYALAHKGTKIPTQDIWLRSWNGRGALPPMQRIDRLEFWSGYPPHRHSWAHGLERNASTEDKFRALIGRMDELRNFEQRDLELEYATIEMGSLLIMHPDENGNMFIQHTQVRAPEVYRTRNGKPVLDENVIGFSLHWGNFYNGKGAGFTGENADRWFVGDYGFYAPLDQITEFARPWDDDGRLVGIEYAPQPLVNQ